MRIFAIFFGIVVLALGLAGFFPQLTHDHYLFCVFRVNFWLNLLQIAIGLFGVIAGLLTFSCARLYFQIVGIFYALLSILGFIYGEKDIFNILANNKPNAWLHMIFAVTALIMGYGKD